MEALSQKGEPSVRTKRVRQERTFAMNLLGVGYAVMTVGLTYLVVLFVGVGDEFQGAPLVPIFATITVTVAIVGLLSLIWVGARRRSWFWLVSAIPAVLLLLMNATYLAYDLARPAITETFVRSLLIFVGGMAIIFGGIAAFLDVRRAQPVWTRTGTIGWGSMAMAGAVMGAAITSFLAGSSASGSGVSEEPTVTGVLTAEKTAFIEASLEMGTGDVLGLFLVNKDPFPHSFDIDKLKIHIQLPPDSTTAVAVKPTETGTLEFFCGVPGHREAGMVGTIAVNA
ncbi:MAG TPA: cupredoxin domain-containing protein [Acidimicrobiia bacterium]|nr:cupredoxin domain-containing protein [Acidimicrobiia bacterium]